MAFNQAPQRFPMTAGGAKPPTNGGGNPPPGVPTRGGTMPSPTQGAPAPQQGQQGASGGFQGGVLPSGPGAGQLQQGFGAWNPAGDQYAGMQNVYPGQQQQFQNPAGIQATASNILPDIYRQPFLQGIEAAAQTGSYSAAALPGAAQFQQGLYSPTLNPLEQQFMQSSGYLGSLGLEQAMNNIGSQYALDPGHNGQNKEYYDAANQFAAQMMQTGSQMGLDRMQMATQNLPNVFNQPLTSAAFGQQSAAGLNNAYSTARYQDTDMAYNIWANSPVAGGTYVQQPQGGKG